MAVVKTALYFPLTQEQANNIAMRKALEAGVALSLGLANNKVQVISINGKAVRRRLVDPASEQQLIEFEIESASSDSGSLVLLQKEVEKAAEGGAIVGTNSVVFIYSYTYIYICETYHVLVYAPLLYCRVLLPWFFVVSYCY